MHQAHALPSVSFVIRIWLEERAPPDPREWRFQARHVQTGEQIYCRSLDELLAFVERRAGVPAPTPPDVLGS